MYGSTPPLPGDIPFDYQHLGLLGLQECNRLYNRCEVGLCLSASNPSRIPFEMMAAGLPVVEFWRENNFYDFHDDSIMLSLPTPESLALAMMQLLNDAEQRRTMSGAAVQFMQSRPLTHESQQFITATNHILAGEQPERGNHTPTYRRPAIVAPSVATQQDVLYAISLAYSTRLAFLPTPVRKFLSQCLQFVRHIVSS